MFYSIPSHYLDAVNQAGLTWSVKEDDFSYANHPYAYWTGTCHHFHVHVSLSYDCYRFNASLYGLIPPIAFQC